jgi:uncharacterized membrane protein
MREHGVAAMTGVATVAVALTVFFVLTSGLEKITGPSELAGVASRAGLSPTAWPWFVRAIGAFEIASASGLVLLDPATSGATAARLLVVAYIVTVTPVGLYLLHRTGECGCGHLPRPLLGDKNRATRMVGLLLRNVILVASVLSVGPVDVRSSELAVATLALAGGVLVQGLLMARRLTRQLSNLPRTIEAASPRRAAQPTYYHL